MAIVFTNLGVNANPDMGTAADATSFATSSWTPPTTGVILCALRWRQSGPENEKPEITGNDLDWHLLAYSDSGSGTIALALYAAFASGSSTGITTFDYKERLVTYFNASFVGFTGGYEGGSLQQAFAQIIPGNGSGTSGSITLPTAVSSNSRPFAAFAHLTAEANTPRTNWTEADDSGVGDSLITEYRSDASETTASATWSSNEEWDGVAVEVRESSDGPTGHTGLDMPYWRLRDDQYILTVDNGWYGAQNAAVSIPQGAIFRLRAAITRNTTGVGVPFTVQWRHEPSGTSPFDNNMGWYDIGVAALSTSPDGAVQGQESSQYADAASITAALLSTSSLTWVNGEAVETITQTGNSDTAAIDLDNGETEVEFALEIVGTYTQPAQRMVLPGDKIFLRIVATDGTAFLNSREIEITVTQNDGYVGSTMAERPGEVIWQDSNGNLYYLCESAEWEPESILLKSTDLGVTWKPVDWPGRPIEVDLEAADGKLVGDTIHIFTQLNNDAYYYRFTPSSHGTTPDEWTLVDDPAKTGVTRDDQIVSGVYRSDGTAIIFFEELIGGDRQITYKIRSSGGTWGSDNNLDSEATDFTDVVTILGPSDLTHIFYIDSTNGRLYHNTITSGDSLGTREEVGTSVIGASGSDENSIAGVYRYTASGPIDRVVVAFKHSNDQIYTSKIDDDGSPSVPVAATNQDVRFDPTGAGNDMPMAALIGDGSDLYIVYAATDGDIWYSKSADYGTWGSDTEVSTGNEVNFFRGLLVVDGGSTYLGYIYENNSLGGNGRGWFEKIDITPGVTVSPAAVAAGADSVDPTVRLGSISVTPSVGAAGADAVAPTVQLGSISLSPTLVAAGADSIDPTVQISGGTRVEVSWAQVVYPSAPVAGDVDVYPAAISAGADSVDPTVQLGSISLSPTLVDASAVGVEPSIQLSDVSVTPAVSEASAVGVEPSVEQDSLSLSPTLAEASAIGVDPTIEADFDFTPAVAAAGADSVDPTVEADFDFTPAVADASAVSVDPSVQLGLLSLSPTSVDASVVSVGPSVEQDSLNVSPAVSESSAIGVDPSVEQGDLNLSPSLVEAGADSVDPSVKQDSLSLSPTLVDASAVGVDPTVEISTADVNVTPAASPAGADSLHSETRQGSLSLSPAVAAAGADSVDPTIDADFDFTPAVVSATATTASPIVQLGDIDLTPAGGTSTAITVAPTVRQSSLSLSPAVAAAGADSVDPTVQIGSPPITPDPAVAGADSIDPSITLSSVSVSPAVAEAGADSINPSVEQDSLALSPTESASGADLVGPTVQLGSLSLSPNVTESGADSVNPTVQVGDLALSPAVAEASAVGVDPTVELSAFDVDVYPAAVVAGADSFHGETRQGSLPLSPTLTDASAVGVEPSVELGDISITPAVAAAATDTVDPEVPIYVPVYPAAATAATASIDPSLYWGSSQSTPAAASAATETLVGDVTEGDSFSVDPATAGTEAIGTVDGGNTKLVVSFARVLLPVGSNLQVFPAPASAGADTVGPSLYFTSDTASPAPASAGADSIDPTLDFSDIDVLTSPAFMGSDVSGPTVHYSSDSASPAPATAGADSVDPTFQYGSISTQALTDANVRAVSVDPTVEGGFEFTPAPATAATDTVAPTVVHGDFSRTPEPASASAVGVDPALHWSSQSASPVPVSSATVASIGNIIEGGATVTPAPASAGADAVGPEVVQWSLFLTISTPSTAATATKIGSVREGGGFLDVYPDPAWAQAAAFVGDTVEDPPDPIEHEPATADTNTSGPEVQITGGYIRIYPEPASARAVGATTWMQVVHSSLSATPTPASAGADSQVGEARQHTLWLAPWEKYAVAVSVDPTVALSSVSVSPAPATAAASTVFPVWVRLGSLNIAPTAAVAATSVVAPTILFQGGYTAVTPAVASIIAVSIDPAVELGPISITPAPAAAGAAVAVGVIIQFSTMDVYPAAVTAGTLTVGPRVSQLAMALYPTPASASTDAPSPTVFLGPEEVTSYPVFARASVTGPTVGLSGHSVSPGAASAAASTTSPTIIYGSVGVSPAVASAIVVSVVGEVLVLDNLYPELDVVINTWTDESDNTTGLFDSIDERPDHDDLDYIKNETPEGEVYRADMDEGVDPGRDDHHYIEYRIRKDSALTQIDLTVTLKEGAVVIATWTHVDIAVAPVTIKQTLTTLQASNITNYSDLYLEFDGVEV